MTTLANIVGPDEMPHYAAFHHGLHCLLRIKSIFREKYSILGEIIICDPSIHRHNCIRLYS